MVPPYFLWTAAHRIGGNTVTFRLTGIFVGLIVATTNIANHPRADTIGIYRPPVAGLFCFFAGGGQQATA